jgi:hypothetical protein
LRRARSWPADYASPIRPTLWIDPARGIGGVIMMQYLPFADARALAVYDSFERGAYRW